MFHTIKGQFFPGGSEVKASASNVGDLGSIPGSGRSPGEGNGNPLQYSYLENLHGQRSLAGYSPWGHKESDTTNYSFLESTVHAVLRRGFLLYSSPHLSFDCGGNTLFI